MTVATHSFPLEHFDPLAVYLHLCPAGPGFLESLNPLPVTGRFSFIPLRWQESYRLNAGRLYRQHAGQKEEIAGNPFSSLAAILAARSVVPAPETPFPGGFFGYFAYDLAGLIEDLPSRARRDIEIPELELDWVDVTATYDHEKKRVVLASLDPTVDLQGLEHRIRQVQHPITPEKLQIISEPKALMSREEFIAKVERGKEYIAAGDIYQVNLSCRFDGRMKGKSSELYRRLRNANPSPFACLLHFPGVDIISSSPERLISLRAGIAETRPIAGTRPRGDSSTKDQQLGLELLAHPKEQAEHVMLLDLERNDLGKVCSAGSVEVDEFMILERYSHVTHIVSNVRGQLNPGCTPFELLAATFPGGTITGVPKKRCMEIIDELEPVGRGSYTGSAGYISAGGEMDLNILIRSFQRLGDTLTYQTGAGIVADSIPEREWQECLQKGAALKAVLQP
ncbi:MAG: anthranilate synthase component I family protein [Desulfuromonadales bacterium]|nr:anthranilate synthase component I family protein [Desulfuromonadales bacterium]MBN2791138.1 anthranilate synthase component I family protein [Desulfuromonadales bacterium]